jgi:hypothetical protein
MKKIVMIALLALITGAAHAQTQFGGVDCGRWVKTQSAVDKTWVAGFISGLNLQHGLDHPNARDPLSKLTSFDQVNVWLDNWCRENPLKNTSLGIYFLFDELKKK